MTDESAFIAAILACPDDDGPRLVYADWLDEHGDPRGEFVRVQCELAGGFVGDCDACGDPLGDDRIADGCPCNSNRGVNCGRIPAYVCTCPICDPSRSGSVRGRPADVEDLVRRERELHSRHGGDWYRSLTALFGGDILVSCAPIDHRRACATVRRGFVETMTCSAADWLANANNLVWRPGLTDPCPESRPGGLYSDYHHGCVSHCQTCGGYGRIARQMPPTAQPIKRVTLTTMPDWEWVGRDGAPTHFPTSHMRLRGGDTFTVDRSDSERDRVLKRLHDRWPGIMFMLPVVYQEFRHVTGAANSYDEMQRTLLESFRVPEHLLRRGPLP